MSTRTTAQLNSDFPVDTYAHFKASSRTFDQLVRDQQLRNDEAAQVLNTQFGTTYMDPLVETAAIAAATLAYTGTAGAVSRKYLCIPNYPLADPTGFQPTVSSLAGHPPYGRPTPALELQQVNNTRSRRYIGGAAAQTALTAAVGTIAATAATLDATDYVSITTPNVGGLHVAGVKYDIVSVDGSGNYFLIAANVAPNTLVKDVGVGAGPFGKDLGAGAGLYGAKYTPFAHTEVAYDATATSVVYAPNTSVPTVSD